jgi:hypothetical protein
MLGIPTDAAEPEHAPTVGNDHVGAAVGVAAAATSSARQPR